MLPGGNDSPFLLEWKGNHGSTVCMENGFQRSYQSIVIEEGCPLLVLVNSIYLNPVRAWMVELGRLSGYSDSKIFSQVL